jgi:protein O-GlcNAc transferase
MEPLVTTSAALLQSAIQLHQAGLLLQAEEAFRDILRLNPGDAYAWNWLGVVQIQQGRLDDAAISFQEALRLRPQFSDAQCNLGAVFLLQGKSELAVGMYQRLLDNNP